MDKMLENKPLARRNHKGKCCFLHGCNYNDSTCSVLAGRVIQRHSCPQCSTPADVLARGLKGDDAQLEARGYLSPVYNNIFLKWGPQEATRPTSTAVLVVEAGLSSTEKLDYLATAAQEAAAVAQNFLSFEVASLKELQKDASVYGFQSRAVKNATGQVRALAYTQDRLVETWMSEVAVGATTSEDAFTAWQHKREVFSRKVIRAEAERLVSANEIVAITSMDAFFQILFMFSLFGIMEAFDRTSRVRNIAKEVKSKRKVWWNIRKEISRTTKA